MLSFNTNLNQPGFKDTFKILSPTNECDEQLVEHLYSVGCDTDVEQREEGRFLAAPPSCSENLKEFLDNLGIEYEQTDKTPLLHNKLTGKQFLALFTLNGVDMSQKLAGEQQRALDILDGVRLY